jgi:hypothetical protein
VGEGSPLLGAMISLVELCLIALPARQPLHEARARGQVVEELERTVLEVLPDGSAKRLGELETLTTRAPGKPIKDKSIYRPSLRPPLAIERVPSSCVASCPRAGWRN